MPELDFCIRFWQNHLHYQLQFMAPEQEWFVKQTIKYLEELKKLKGEG